RQIRERGWHDATHESGTDGKCQCDQAAASAWSERECKGKLARSNCVDVCGRRKPSCSCRGVDSTRCRCQRGYGYFKIANPSDQSTPGRSVWSSPCLWRANAVNVRR